MFRKLFVWMQKYERHLSALAMVSGFIVDYRFFGRIDLWRTQALFATYAIVCFISIASLHWIEGRAMHGVPRPRWRSLFPIATQFSLGGFWSGFLIFYGRGAVVSASWPFLLVLLAIFIGNEYFHRYHDRLVFTNILFFFALYSYAIFAVPIYTGTMGEHSFLESGVVATVVFMAFILLLYGIARERFRSDAWRICIGAVGVSTMLNVFYFTNILPPLPLAAEAAGIYHAVWRVPGAYLASTEAEPWSVRYLGSPPTMHVVMGESLSAYSAIFAPTMLTTTIVHRWQWYDPTTGQWVTKAVVAYPIVGGRDGGYRGYSTALISVAGMWRVNIETLNGRPIARLPFTVVQVALSPPESTTTLQ